MTMRRLTVLYKCTRFWAAPPPTYHLASCNFSLFPQNEVQAEELSLWYCEDPAQITDSTEHTLRSGLPESIPRVAEALEAVYCCTWRLL